MTDLRRLAEQATPGPWTVIEGALYGREDRDLAHIHSDLDAAYIAAANPQAILGLLDDKDALAEAVEEGLVYMAAAERKAVDLAAERDDANVRVAALEEGLRVLLDARMGNYGQQVGAENKARALLASASNEAEVPAAPPADDGTPYQSPDLHTGTEHSDRVLTDDK